jgi:outer membrane protein OmpA-like peptidoglycan-associated protein
MVWVLLGLLPGCSAHRDLIVPLPDTDGKGDANRANPEVIVLLPDPDGKVGTIQVTTRGGSQILEKPWYATQLEDFSKPPTAPELVNEREITDVFGEALSAQPDLAGRFTSFILWFESGNTKLTHASKKLLPEIARTIKKRKAYTIYVIGHTDRVGTEVYNTKLSSRRAKHVRDVLVSNGIRSSAFVVSFHGEAMPLVYAEDEVAEPLNRRVEVIVR